eukprot:6864838-Ditylum_brightwellii.AAC.1
MPKMMPMALDIFELTRFMVKSMLTLRRLNVKGASSAKVVYLQWSPLWYGSQDIVGEHYLGHFQHAG